jgi:hypothetical protein
MASGLGDLPKRAQEPAQYEKGHHSYQTIETHTTLCANAVTFNTAANAKRTSPTRRAIAGSNVGGLSATAEEAAIAYRCASASRKKQDRVFHSTMENVKTLETLRSQCRLMLGRLDDLHQVVSNQEKTNRCTC